jgi:hypothetical protein
VAEDGEPFVLIDGYKRQAALIRLGRDTAQRDTAQVDMWEAALAADLVQALAHHQARALEHIEQPWPPRPAVLSEIRCPHAAKLRSRPGLVTTASRAPCLCFPSGAPAAMPPESPAEDARSGAVPGDASE